MRNRNRTSSVFYSKNDFGSSLFSKNASNSKKNGGAPVRTVGIVAEYNPFHKGHLYHLE
ncbi:MAG: nucleotidyltransferase family protein, partial [Clostridia bacterium]|nr:nucleotidyltransferase family protein [Clostridia bacterium]